MPLSDILRKVAASSGHSDYASNANIKAALLDVINHAAEEVYESTDLPGCLRELYVSAPYDSEIALPPFVGVLRALRETNLRQPWNIYDMRPRYHQVDWPSIWRNWRYIGTSPLKLQLTNTAPLSVTIYEADATLTVTVVGSTANSSHVSETVTMTTTEQVLTKSFLTVESIQKNKVSSYDISILDADDVEVSTISNDELEARFQIYDISKYPYAGDMADGGRLMEILYKLPLRQMVNDSDKFPVDGYETVIVDKCRQLLAEEVAGQEQRAMMMDSKVKRTIGQKVEHQEGTITRRANFGKNPLYDLYDRWA